MLNVCPCSTPFLVSISRRPYHLAWRVGNAASLILQGQEFFFLGDHVSLHRLIRLEVGDSFNGYQTRPNIFE